MTTDQIIREMAEAWHAPNCMVDAGGACIVDDDIKDAWIAGYQAGAGVYCLIMDSGAAWHILCGGR